MLSLVCWQCFPYRIDGVCISTQRGNGKLKNPGHSALCFRCHRGGVLCRLFENVQNMGRHYLTDWQHAYAGKYNPFQHLQPLVFGYLFPILKGKPFLGYGLEGVGVFVSGLDTIQLLLVRWVNPGPGYTAAAITAILATPTSKKPPRYIRS